MRFHELKNVLRVNNVPHGSLPLDPFLQSSVEFELIRTFTNDELATKTLPTFLCSGDGNLASNEVQAEIKLCNQKVKRAAPTRRVKCLISTLS